MCDVWSKSDHRQTGTVIVFVVLRHVMFFISIMFSFYILSFRVLSW